MQMCGASRAWRAGVALAWLLASVAAGSAQVRAATSTAPAAAAASTGAAERSSQNAPVHAYRMWDWGETPARSKYEMEVLRMALQKTVPEYGPFSTKRLVDRYSTLRIRREVNQAASINLHVGPWRSQEDIPVGERNIAIDVPLLQGTLGCRRLIVRRADLPAFARIGSSEEIKRLTAGLGRGWTDVRIFRHNGYKVDDSGNGATLLAMLANRRFDYLPLGAIEVNDVLARSPQLAAKLAVVPNLQIYYPLPVVFYVSPKTPVLAKRLREGLRMVQKDGSMDKAFAQAFPNDVCGVKDPAMRHFILANPFVPADSPLDARLFPQR